MDRVVEWSEELKDRARQVQDRAARDRAAEARARADHDRDLLERTRAELAEDEGGTAQEP
jgi:hypothetical protein